MKKRTIILSGLFLLLFHLHGQDTILDRYIQTGLENNLMLKQKQLNYTKSVAALKEARGLFYPNISLNARYTVANGGRVIDFPVGDLLNPIYGSLNALTAGLPPEQQFPDIQIENQEFYFFRPTEQFTNLSLYQPIYNPDVIYNHRIKRDFVEAEYLDVNIYKRELIAAIKKAYFNHQQTQYVLELLQQTLELVSENVRVNESLFANDKVTHDVVDRSEAERSKVEQQIAEAEKNNQVARAYFNFLLNKPLDSPVKRWDDPVVKTEKPDFEQMLGSALVNREELKLIEVYANATENNLKLNQRNKIPSLIAAIDYGIQGTNYAIDENSDFFLGSLVLKWDLFTGSSNNARIQQARLEQKILEQRQEELENQISMEVIKAYYELLAAEKSIQSARDQRNSTRSAFDLINKKYNQGQASLIQFLDARNSMTNAEENLIITVADYFVKLAELERIAGTYDLGDR